MLTSLASFGVFRPLLRNGGYSEQDKKRLLLDSIKVIGERRTLAVLSTVMDSISACDCGGLKQRLQ